MSRIAPGRIRTDSGPVNSNGEMHKFGKMSRLIFVLVIDFWKVVQYLEKKYCISSLLSFVGVSAGVDQALSLVSVKSTVRELDNFDIHSFTAVAGAYHPTLYEMCFDTFIADDTYVIVLHHFAHGKTSSLCGLHLSLSAFDVNQVVFTGCSILLTKSTSLAMIIMTLANFSSINLVIGVI